jgi:hypothetical protein
MKLIRFIITMVAVCIASFCAARYHWIGDKTFWTLWGIVGLILILTSSKFRKSN